jgi:hypothetical protein
MTHAAGLAAAEQPTGADRWLAFARHGCSVRSFGESGWRLSKRGKMC